jgi:hypothetical protein
MASIKCGHCGNIHESVDEVRNCAGARPDASVAFSDENGNVQMASVERQGENFFLTNIEKDLYDLHEQELKEDHPGHRQAFNRPQATAEDRVYLSVPFHEKDHAKALGARWDPARKMWWFNSAALDRAPFSRWLGDAPQAAQPKASAAPEQLADGFYRKHNGIYKVVHNQEGDRQYAKVLLVEEGAANGTWAYAPGIVNTLDASMLLTEAEAAEFGKLYGVCGICGRQLTNEDSIERGIGPICATKMGW